MSALVPKKQLTYARTSRQPPKPLQFRCPNEPAPQPIKPHKLSTAPTEAERPEIEKRALLAMRRYYETVDSEELEVAVSTSDSEENEELCAPQAINTSQELATWKQRHKLKRDELKTAMHVRLSLMRSEEREDDLGDLREEIRAGVHAELVRRASDELGSESSGLETPEEIPESPTEAPASPVEAEDMPATPEEEPEDTSVSREDMPASPQETPDSPQAEASSSDEEDKENCAPMPTTPKQAFDRLRNRRHRRVGVGAQHFSQQQLLAALQAINSECNRTHGWDQETVDRTMNRWSSEKQAKADKDEATRTAEAKFWRKQKQKLVLNKFKEFKLFGRMEARAQEAPKQAKAKWQAMELQRNFGCWLRGSRGVRERAAAIGGESVTLWHRSDLMWSQNSQGVSDWQRNVVQQLRSLSAATPIKSANACRSSAELLGVLPDELTARILLTAGDSAMCRAACACKELQAHIEVPYMWQLLCRVRWGAMSLSMVEEQMGWKFAYIRRDRMEKMSIEERQELELETQRLFIQGLDNEDFELDEMTLDTPMH